jgi:hypothetical protein
MLVMVAGRSPSFVIAGHSRPKDGVASLAYDPAIHDEVLQRRLYVGYLLKRCIDARVKPGHDAAA